MPTPFSHLLISHLLLSDGALSSTAQQMIQADRPAFLLGGVVADARPNGSQRSDTHFYHYTEPMPDHPWREMLRRYPALQQPKSDAHRAFLAGYVAHLAVDEYWSRYLLRPHIAEADWGKDIYDRFFVLHLLLIYMDERDENQLPEAIPDTLRQSIPDEWLPFIPDQTICEWRDFIADQILGESQTLAIFGARIKREASELRELLDDANFMEQRLWGNITRTLFSKIEASLYQFAREQMEIYLAELASI